MRLALAQVQWYITAAAQSTLLRRYQGDAVALMAAGFGAEGGIVTPAWQRVAARLAKLGAIGAAPELTATCPLLAGAVRSGHVQAITNDGSEHNAPETEAIRTVMVAVAAPEDVGRENPEDALQAALPVALVALGNVACLLKRAVLEEIATPFFEERTKADEKANASEFPCWLQQLLAKQSRAFTADKWTDAYCCALVQQVHEFGMEYRGESAMDKWGLAETSVGSATSVVPAAGCMRVQAQVGAGWEKWIPRYGEDGVKAVGRKRRAPEQSWTRGTSKKKPRTQMADCEPSKPRTLQYDWKGKDLGPRNSLEAMDNNVQYEVFGVTKGTLTVKPAGGQPFVVRAGEFMRLDKSLDAKLTWTEGAMEKAYMYFTKTGVEAAQTGCDDVAECDVCRFVTSHEYYSHGTGVDDKCLCRLCFVQSEHAAGATWARYRFGAALPLTAEERGQIGRMKAVAREYQ